VKATASSRFHLEAAPPLDTNHDNPYCTSCMHVNSAGSAEAGLTDDYHMRCALQTYVKGKMHEVRAITTFPV